MRISDWSSDVCSSELQPPTALYGPPRRPIFRREILAPFKRPHADPALRSWPCYQAECRRISICRRPPPFGSHPMIQTGLSAPPPKRRAFRSEEHTSELQSLMRISYAAFCLKNKTKTNTTL